MKNTLYYGDNLVVLRSGSIKDESVDLIYLDPPFNSNATFNVLFSSPKGHKSDAQIEAFEDTWHWGPLAEEEFAQILRSPNTDVAEMMQSLRSFLSENDVMAYLTMMANRLLELHRVLRDTGSLFLHCDSTMSHYLKIVLDAVFGVLNYRNEIIWERTTAGKPISRNLPKNFDTIFWYTKSGDYTFHLLTQEFDKAYADTFNQDDKDGRGPYNTQPIINPGDRPHLKYVYKSADGRLWQPPKNGWRFKETRMRSLEKDRRLQFTKHSIREKYYLWEREKKGKQMSNIWTDIPISSRGERLGYPTQKPLALLERIIDIASNAGDTVLDPFCGCGTAVHAAQKLHRHWIGIDITSLAIGLIEKRLKDAFPKIQFNVEGTPVDLEGARDLALRDKYQFQWWACTLVDAQPYRGKKKGADSGIDGLIFFEDEKGKAKKVIVSVKGGENVGLTMVKDLIATVQGENAEIGLFVTLTPPTRPMIAEAAKTGYYDSPLGKSYPRIQILTIADLVSKKVRPQYPLSGSGGLTFKRAKVELKDSKSQQASLLYPEGSPELDDDDL